MAHFGADSGVPTFGQGSKKLNNKGARAMKSFKNLEKIATVANSELQLSRIRREHEYLAERHPGQSRTVSIVAVMYIFVAMYVCMYVKICTYMCVSYNHMYT